MKFNIISIFPGIFTSYFSESILKRAQNNKIINIKVHNLRDFTADKHKTVDDRPYGGGAGMLMLIEPIYKALKKITKKPNAKRRIILLSAQGRTWNQQLAKKYLKYDELVLLCGRYEGVDERVKKLIDDEISIGNYVLTGGELGAMVITDSIARLLPGALGNNESSKDESHSQPGILEYPQYTKPPIFTINNKKHRVPPILFSGNHQKIKEWREKHKKSQQKA